MYLLVRRDSLTERMVREVPAGLAALVVAEIFFKFHSFSLECLAFLATWFVLGWATNAMFPVTRPSSFDRD